MQPRRFLLVVGLAALVLAVGAVVAIAQPPQPDQGGPFGLPPAQPGGDQMQPMRGGFPGMGMMGPTASPAIAVADGFVFVVQGGTLYKFDANSLEQVGKVTFIEPPQLAAPMGGGDPARGNRGARGGGNAPGGQPPIQ